MTGPTRARVGPRWLTAIMMTLIAAVGVPLALAFTAGAAASSLRPSASAAAYGGDPSPSANWWSSARARAAQRGTATMTVEVGGLPRHVHGNVKLTGPGRKSRRITTTTKLTGLAPGSYTVAAQPIVSGASTYHPTISVCSASSRCSSGSHGRITLKERQRAVVRVTYAVRKSAATPGAPGTPGTPGTPGSPSPGGTPQSSPEGRLSSKKSESGGWSATISVPSGGPQTQADGVVSFSIPLARGEKVKFTYRNEREALEPRAPCLGSVNEPVAEPGNLCVYRGGAGFGSKENEDRNAKFVQFEDFFGETIKETGEANSGDLGVLIIFRTNEFATEGGHLALAKEAHLTASGSWAVTAK
jgi:hypothetical protein